MVENWTVGELQCRARARFGGEGKNETVSGKGDDGAGKVEPVYEPISFSAKASPPLSIISNPPIRYFTAVCTFWGANCLLNNYFTAFEAV